MQYVTYLVSIVVATLKLACQRVRPSRWKDNYVDKMTELKLENRFHLNHVLDSKSK